MQSPFHRNLKKIRSQRGYTHKDVADLVKTSQSAISKFEKDQEPKASMIVALSMALGCTPNELLLEEDQTTYIVVNEKKYTRDDIMKLEAAHQALNDALKQVITDAKKGL